jgi:hypothetical protein
MSDTPPTDGEGDDVEGLYRKSAAQYPSRPSTKVRQAILEHSAQLAANRRHAPGVGRIPRVTRSPSPKWRRPVLLGSLAAAAMAGLLVGPQFLRPSAPPVALRGSPTTTIPALQLPKSSATSASAKAQTGESPRIAIDLPAPAPAPGAPAPAMHLSARAAAAAPANPDQAASGASEPTGTGGISAAASADDVQPTVTAVRARQAASAAAASIDARDSEGRTALMSAVLQGRLDAVVALLRKGADANAADFAGVTPLQAARAKHLPEIADALIEAGAR